MARVNVYPGAKRPTHEISLSDGIDTWGLRLADGPQSINDVPATASTINFTGGGTKFGDWEPGISHIEQRSWHGGRAQEDFSNDNTRYADARMAWTLTEGKAFPSPNVKFATGFVTGSGAEEYQYLPGDMGWIGLYPEYIGTATQITHSSGWSQYDRLTVWVKKIGQPGNLAVRLYTNSGGEPGLQQANISVSEADIPEEGIPFKLEIDWTGQSATIGTTSFIALFGNTTDNQSNHWRIGVDADGGGSLKYENTPLSYSAADYTMYYRIQNVPQNRKMEHFFEYYGALYVISNTSTAAAAKIYINGDRGISTTSSTQTLLNDTAKSWTTNEWAGAWLKTMDGPPENIGKVRKIASNTSTSLTLEGNGYDVSMGTTTEYVIFDTPIWTDITPGGGVQLDNPVKDVCVVDDFVYLAIGTKTAYPVVRMRWDSGTPGHLWEDDTGNQADFILYLEDPDNEAQVYYFDKYNCTVAHSPVTAWGTPSGFGKDIEVGDSNHPINGVYVHNGEIYAFKANGRYKLVRSETTFDKGLATSATTTTLTDTGGGWTADEFIGYYVKIVEGTGVGQLRLITDNTTTQLTVATWTTTPDTTSKYKIFEENDFCQQQLGDIGFIKSLNNGEALLSYGLYTYFSWGGYSIQRLYDLSGNYDLSNIGPDRDAGLPSDRLGKVVQILGLPPGILIVMNGEGSTTSSIMVLPNNGINWHEIYRADTVVVSSVASVDLVPKELHTAYFQKGGEGIILWISEGENVLYQKWPAQTFNPIKDDNMTYNPYAELISSTIDMGASRIPKLIKEISLISENLDTGIHVGLDYQLNEDVGTSTWIDAGNFQISNEDVVEVGRGEVYQIRFRLRMETNDESIPPIIDATVLEAFSRTPVKYQWIMRLRISDTQRDKSGVGFDHDPDEFVNWLKFSATKSRRIFMRSVWEQLDSRYVVIEPPTIMREFNNDILGYWGGTLQLTIREE